MERSRDVFVFFFWLFYILYTSRIIPHIRSILSRPPVPVRFRIEKLHYLPIHIIYNTRILTDLCASACHTFLQRQRLLELLRKNWEIGKEKKQCSWVNVILCAFFQVCNYIYANRRYCRQWVRKRELK